MKSRQQDQKSSRYGKVWLEPELLDCWEEKNRFVSIMQMQGEVYRQIEKRVTLRFTHNQRHYFIKKHHGIPAAELVKSLLLGRKPIAGARNEVDVLNRLHELGVKAPRVVGFGEQGCYPLSKQSFVITQEVSQALSLDTYESSWKNQEMTWKMKQYLLCQVATITRILHQNGINHRDLYACHFMIAQTSADYPDITLMDLHRAAIRKKTPSRWIIKDLASLYYSILNFNLTKRDKYRFMEYYSGRSWRVEIMRSLEFWSAVKKRTKHFIKRHSKFFGTPLLNNAGE